mgnify:CR=1 FL=1
MILEIEALDAALARTTYLVAGLVPELQITPDPTDFGTVYVGCDKPEVITLTNVGTDGVSAVSARRTGTTTIAIEMPAPDFLPRRVLVPLPSALVDGWFVADDTPLPADPIERLVYASSSSVYGDDTPLPPEVVRDEA